MKQTICLNERLSLIREIPDTCDIAEANTDAIILQKITKAIESVSNFAIDQDEPTIIDAEEDKPLFETVDRRNGKNYFTPEQKKRIYEEYQTSGYGNKQAIMDKWGMSKVQLGMMITTYRLKKGVAQVRRGGKVAHYSPEEKEKFILKYAKLSGKQRQKYAKSLGLANQTVANYMWLYNKARGNKQ